MTRATDIRRRHRAILVALVPLVVLTIFGTAPAGPVATPVGSMGAMTSTTTQTDGSSFAQRFNEVTGRGEEGMGGEGQNVAVAVADPAAATQADTAVSAPTAAPALQLPPVEPVRPALVVRDADPALVEQLRGVEGIGAVAGAQKGQLVFEGMPEEGPLTVAAVDPMDFRAFTPEITATADGVWERLLAGDAAVTHDAGNRMLAPLGGVVMANGSPEPLRIGAFASNGIPSVADALISAERAAQLGLTGPTDLYVALAEGASIDAVSTAVQGLAAGATVEVLEAPAEQQAFLEGSAAAAFFEPFNYVDHGDGLITIDPSWVSRNIETRQLPIFRGQVTCHRQMLVQLEGALREVEQAGLAPLIDVTDYGGCWVARHIDWRPDRPLSMHAWGLAVDFNVRTNGLGRTPTMDPRIVAIFDRWGFVWGGRWSRPDGMHFELGAVLSEPTGSLSAVPGQ